MDTWWWLVLGAVVALSLVTALVDGGARLGPRRRGRRRGVPLPDRGPRPGEIWWTQAPRLVLVLAVGLENARVAQVGTERPREHGTGDVTGATLALPPGTVADAPGRVSCLHTDSLREVALTDFRHRAGEVDQDTWAQVRQLTGQD